MAHDALMICRESGIRLASQMCQDLSHFSRRLANEGHGRDLSRAVCTVSIFWGNLSEIVNKTCLNVVNHLWNVFLIAFNEWPTLAGMFSLCVDIKKWPNCCVQDWTVLTVLDVHHTRGQWRNLF